MNRLVLFLLYCLFSSFLFAQQGAPKLTVSTTDVQENETFMLSVQARADGKVDLNLPPGIQVLGSSRNVTSSSSFTIIINGKVQQSGGEQTIAYNYTCKIPKVGKYMIDNATFQTGTKKYILNTVSISVSKAPLMSNSLKNNLNKNFFGVIGTNKSKVYVGEAFVASSKVYSKARITDIADFKPTEVKGTLFKSDLFKDRKNISAKLEKIEGISFQTIEITRDLIIPQKEGLIHFSPFQIKIGYQGNFFFSDYTNINSGEANIRVLPLPKNAPSFFNGAVGKFNVSSQVSKNTLKEGDAFVYSITISGTGNLHLLSVPVLNLPESFEVYGDPKIIDNHKLGANGAEGSIKYEFIIRALEKGEYVLPAFEFAYFNPSTEKYVELKTSNFSIKVLQGDSISSMQVYNDKVGIQLKNQEIKYIAKTANNQGDFFLWKSVIFWLALLLPLFIAAPLGLFMRKRKQNQVQIENQHKFKKAGKFASSKLQKAQDYLNQGNEKAFYDEVFVALKTFIAQKAKSPISSLTKERMQILLHDQGMEANDIEQFMHIWNELESVKYGLRNSQNPNHLLDEVASLIFKIESVWKK